MTFGQALERRVFGGTEYDLVLGLGGVASYLSREELDGLVQHAGGPVVLTAYASEFSPALGGLVRIDLDQAGERLTSLTTKLGGIIRICGRFSVAIISQG